MILSKKIFLFSVFIVQTIISISQISADRTSGCAPLTDVQFTSSTPGDWDFKDGGTAANTSNPIATFSNPGVYDVTFDDGVNPPQQLTITVFGEPVSDFTLSDSSGCPTLTPNFTDQSIPYTGTNIVKWSWDFGDGTSSTAQNPNHAYTSVGNYSVSLIVEDDQGCVSSSASITTITLKTPPTASFSVSPNASCTAPLTVFYNNTSTNGAGGTTNLTYAWDFGDGTTSTDAAPGPHTYTGIGNNTVSLTVTEPGACSRTTTRNVNIGAPSAAITIADTVCLGVNTIYQNGSTGGNAFNWSFDDGTTSTQQNPTHAFNTPGDHEVTLIVSAGGCADTTTTNVFVQEIVADFVPNPTYQCDRPFCIDFTDASSALAVDWEYDFGDGNTSTDQNPQNCYQLGGDEYTVYYNQGYTYRTTLTVTSASGCEATTSFVDTIFPISANFAPDETQGCAPLEVTFQDSSASGSNITSYKYDFGDGSTATGDSVVHTFSTAGEYDVTLTIENENGCRDTSFPITILVGEPIDLDMNVAPSTVCIGDTVTFTDISNDARIDGYHFATDENRTSQNCPSDAVQQWSFFHETGQHDVTFIADYNGCVFEEVFSNAVTVNGPSSYFNWNGNCDDPTNISFTSVLSDVDSIYWDFGDGDVLISDDLADSVTTHRYDTTGNYTVTLITTNNTTGCPNDTSTMVVKVRMLQAIIDGDTLVCAGPYIGYGGFSVDADANCDNTYQWDWDNSPPRLEDQPYFNSSRNDTGTFTLRLIVRDVHGCKDTATQEVVVSDIYAGFEPDVTSGCLPLTVAFTDTSYSAFNLVNWDWDFDNGLTGTGSTSNTTFTSSTTSNYDVKLVVTDSLGCKDSTTVRITPLIPDSNFIADDRTICVGDDVTFTLANEGAAASATWDFGGEGSSTDLNPTFTFTNGGTFDISVNITDTNGCTTSRTRSAYVSVDAYPTALISSSLDTAVAHCYPKAYLLTDVSTASGGTSVTSRSWSLSNGVSTTNSTVSGNFNQPDNYTARLISRTTNGCRDTTNIDLDLVGAVGNFVMDKTTICVGEEVTFTLIDTNNVGPYNWDFNDGATANRTSPVTHQFNDVPNSGIRSIDLVLWDKDSVCRAPVVSKPLNIYQVEARFGLADSTVCLDKAVVFLDSSLTTANTSYSWDIGSGSIFTSSQPSPQIYSSPGVYDITLTLDDPVAGCKDELTKQVEILPFPVVTTNSAEMCEGDSALLVADGAATYLWVDSTIISNFRNDSAYTYALSNTTHLVIGTDTNGCTSNATADVLVYEDLPLVIDEQCIIIGEEVTIGKDYGPGYTYDWTTGPTEHLACTDCAVQTFQITKESDDPIIYQVSYDDPLSCFPKTDQYSVCVIDNYTVDVPSAFTPDGVGENNVIYVKGHGIKELVYFKIYNRWGELVFETNNIDVGWDGTYKGQDQDMETFVYQAKVEFYNGMSEEKGGQITLIR